MTSGMLFVINFWKGRRKDKDSPTPPSNEEQKEYLEEVNIRDRISDTDLFKLVALPPMIDVNEWLATNTISFFNHVNLIYGVVSEYCNAESCPIMTAPDNVQYFWYDDKGKKTKHTAAQYIDYVMTHIQKVVNDESVFPTKFGHQFPPDLESVVKRIHKYLFHVLAHIYHAHYRLLRQLGLHAHLNTLFTHFMVFTSKFDLVQDKESDILLHLFSLLLKNLADPAHNAKLREGLGIGSGDVGHTHDSKPSDSSNPPEDDAAHTAVMASDSTATTTTSSTQRMSNGGSNLMHSVCDSHTSTEHNGLQKNSSAAPPCSPTSQGRKGSEETMMDTDPSTPPSEWLSNLQVSAT